MSDLEKQTLIEAKKAVKMHIKFMEKVLKNLDAKQNHIRNGALITAFSLHEYIINNLPADIKKHIEKNKEYNVQN